MTGARQSKFIVFRCKSDIKAALQKRFAVFPSPDAKINNLFYSVIWFFARKMTRCVKCIFGKKIYRGPVQSCEFSAANVRWSKTEFNSE